MAWRRGRLAAMQPDGGGDGAGEESYDFDEEDMAGEEAATVWNDAGRGHGVGSPVMLAVEETPRMM